MRCREYQHFTQIINSLASQRIDNRDSLNGVTEHLDTSDGFVIGRLYLNRVSTHPEISTSKSHVISVVLQIYKPTQDTALVVINSDMKFKQVPSIFLRITHSINAAHRCNNDGVAPRE